MTFTDDERYILGQWFGYRSQTYMTDSMLKQAVKTVDERGGDGMWVLGAAIWHLLHKRGAVHR